LRGLKKKIQQIEKLKSKQDEGEVLEDLHAGNVSKEKDCVINYLSLLNCKERNLNVTRVEG
jgi:hypothetical protein